MESSKAPKTKHISYSSREDYITDLEEMLMQKYRVGYSALHKRLLWKKVISYSTEQFDQINSQRYENKDRLLKKKSEGRTVN